MHEAIVACVCTRPAEQSGCSQDNATTAPVALSTIPSALEVCIPQLCDHVGTETPVLLNKSPAPPTTASVNSGVLAGCATVASFLLLTIKSTEGVQKMR